MGVLAATAPEDLWRAWSLDPLALALAAVSIGFFVAGWRRLRRRRAELAAFSRLWLFLAGVSVVLVGIVSPLDTIAEEYLQSAHMLQHVLIADVGIALTLVAVRGPLSVFFLPRDLLAPLARTRWLRSWLTFALRPVVAISAWVAVVVAWHIPALYEGALANPLVHRLEHFSFVVVGLLVWTLIVDPTRHHRLTIGERVGVVTVVFFAGQILSYVMVFATSPFYSTYVDAPHRLLGLSALTDQKLAGVVMMVEQAVTLGIAFVLLLRLGHATAGASEPKEASG